MAGSLTADHLRDAALAVADAKAWERDLDRAATSASSQKGLAISDNPMLQIYICKQDIQLKERDEWEAWLLDRQVKHRQQTQEIIRLETALNARVYALFKLTTAEIDLIEESTKYRYGEV